MEYHCMINAFARLLRVSSQYLVENLDHDGLGVFAGTTVERTHHVQEILEVTVALGLFLCPIELVPQSTNNKQLFQIFFGDGTVNANFTRFKMHLDGNEGVILGMRGDIGHAVYWDGKKCHDSESWELWGEDSNFIPGVFWRAVWT